MRGGSRRRQITAVRRGRRKVLSHYGKIDLPLFIIRWRCWGDGTVEAIAAVRPVLGNLLVKFCVQWCKGRGF